MMDMILEAQLIKRTNMMVNARKAIENAIRELAAMDIYLPELPNLNDKAAMEKFGDEVYEIMEEVGRDAWEGDPCHWFEEISCALWDVLYSNY